jgi:putative MATE family efflux protein
MIHTLLPGRKKSESLQGFYKALLFIALPITLQQLMQTFVNMLDTIMVGQLGAVQIAAVGLGNQIFFILNMILFGISSGGSIFIAQYWGKKDIAGIRHTMGIMLSISMIVSLLFAFLAIIFPETLISLYSKDPAVISSGGSYLRYVGISYPFMAFGFVYQFAFRSTEHVRLPMVSTMVSFFINALFNYLLIFGMSFSIGRFCLTVPAMGVTGAAIATVISRVAELAILLIYSYSKHYEASGPLKEIFNFDHYTVIRFIKIALPVIFNETLWGTGITIQNSIFAHAGTNSIAAFNITTTVSQLTWVFFIGMGNGAAIIIGKRIGSGNADEARRYANRFAWFMPLMAFFFGILLYPLSLTLPLIFKVDRGILWQAQLMLVVLMCNYPFNAFNMCMIVGICRSGGDTKFGAFCDLFWMWTVSIPLGFAAAFVFHWEPWQIYLCLQTEQLLKAVTGFIRLRSGRWLHNVTF